MSMALFSFDKNRYEDLGEYASQPMWLPDSRRFVFASGNKVFLGNIETRKVREVYSMPSEQIRSVAVSRDGRLLYYTLFSSESDIWLVDLE